MKCQHNWRPRGNTIYCKECDIVITEKHLNDIPINKLPIYMSSAKARLELLDELAEKIRNEQRISTKNS